MTYNTLGAPDTLTYPTSTAGVRFKVKYAYTGGVLSAIQDYTGNVNGTVYWNLNLLDASGHPVSETYGNGLWLQNAFDPLTGEAKTRQAGTGGQAANVQNLAYAWDKAGNLGNRQDLRQGLTESFTHDALDRLTLATGPGTQSLSIAYDAIGNVTSRSDIAGSFTYDATRKHAVTAAGPNSYAYDANGNMTTRNGATILWTSANLPSSLNASGFNAFFAYAPDRSRWRQVASYSGGNETTTYVGGLLEILTTSTRTHWKHRIFTPSGEVQVIRRNDATSDVYYVTTDHLGSTDTVMDAAATILARESFGAWGARRSSTWQGNPSPTEWQSIANTTRRGYTGHEELDNLLLVHMNGRVYDPAIGRFLAADPYVSGIDASQGWNRYAYVSNRPLSYTDPSGYFDRGFSLQAYVRAIEPGRTWEFSYNFSEGQWLEHWTLTLNYNSLGYLQGLQNLLRDYGRELGERQGRGGEGGGGGGGGGARDGRDSRHPKPPCEADSSQIAESALALESAIGAAAAKGQDAGVLEDAISAFNKNAQSLGSLNAGRIVPGNAISSVNWSGLAKGLGVVAIVKSGYDVYRGWSEGGAAAAYATIDAGVGLTAATFLGPIAGTGVAFIYSTAGGSRGIVNEAKAALGLCTKN